jgi:uncharacterized protein YndB with AHSA1/START domain
MADIFQEFPIKATPGRVFEAVTTPEGLNTWWTKQSSGEPVLDSRYELYFGPDSDWTATVIRSVQDRAFELQITTPAKDWEDTRIGFRLEEKEDMTWVHFHHTGWPEDNAHYRISCHCWALYLRLLRRFIEHGEVVPYEKRLDA